MNITDSFGEWLKCPDLTNDEKGLIHLHALGVYSLYPLESIQENELEDIVQNWIFYKQNSISKEMAQPALSESILRWYNFVCINKKDFFRNNPVKINNLLNSVLEGLAVNKGNLSWNVSDFPCFSTPKGRSHYWEVNLLTAEISNEVGLIRNIQHPDFRSNEDYVHLFGLQLYSMRSIGTDFYFYHTLYRQMRIIPYEKLLIIQKQDDEGNWWQYHNSLDFLPMSLQADHSHWMRLKNQNVLHERDRIEIIDKKSGVVRGIIDSEVNLKMLGMDKRGEQVYEDVYHLADQSWGNLIILEKFERRKYITLSQSMAGPRISFTRYRSIDGIPLMFESKKNQYGLFWKENSTYCLSEKRPKGLLGTIPNYLFLESSERKNHKILVPFQMILQSAQLSTHVSLDVKDKCREEEYSKIEEKYCPQACVYQFIEYDERGGELQALNTEGWIYLAYLYLAQRQYDKALNGMRNVTKNDPLTPMCFDCLKLIMESKETLPDRSPNACAVRLQLVYLFIKILDLPNNPIEDKEKYYSKIILKAKDDYRIYLDGLNNVDQMFALDRDQEEFLVKKCNMVHYEKRKFVQKGFDWRVLPMRFKFKNSSFETNEILNKKFNLSFLVKKIEDFRSWEIVPDLKFNDNKFYERFSTLYSMAISKNAEERKFVNWYLDQMEWNEEDFSSPFPYILYLALYKQNVALQLPKEGEDQAAWIRNMLNSYKEKIAEIQKSLSNNLTTANKAPVPFKRISFTEEPALIIEKPSLKTFINPILYVDQYNAILNYIQPVQKSFKNLPEDDGVLPPNIPISKEEIYFKDCIDAEYAEFRKDYLDGRKKNLERTYYNLVGDIDRLIVDLEGNLKLMQQGKIPTIIDNPNSKVVTDEFILYMANRRTGLQSDIRIFELLKLTGGMSQTLTMPRLIHLFLKRDYEGISKCNPHLKKMDIELIYKAVGEYLQHQTEMQWLERILELARDYKTEKNRISRASLLQKLGNEIASKRAYEPNKEPDCLVFEYQSNMRIRQEQYVSVCNLDKQNGLGRFNNLVIQLKMGGGKTSVLASLLCYRAARPNRLSLFIVPAAQFENVKNNIKVTQRQNYGQEINDIDLNRKQFTNMNIKWVRETLEMAIKNGEMVIVKPELVQSLGLEFVHCVDRLTHVVGEKEIAELIEKIDDLNEIIDIFTHRTDAIGDEIEQLLSIIREVNFPEGIPSKIKAERIEAVKDIYEVLQNNEVPSGKPNLSLKQFVGLKENQQSLISSADYQLYVRSKLAKHLAKRSEKLFIESDDLKTSYERYLNGQMNPNLQEILSDPSKKPEAKDVRDLQFLIHMKELYESKDPNLHEKHREAANVMALTKQMLKSVLCSTLTKNGNRHYGRAHKGEKSKVVPYLGVGTPATTNFGLDLEAMAYHFQTAITFGIESDQILELSKALKESATYYSIKNQEQFDQTPEAIEFHKLTGVSLHSVENPGELEKAVKHVNQDIARVLELEINTIAQVVTFYQERYTSSSLTLVSLIDTWRAFSGTPSNISISPLAGSCVLTSGTEGSFAHCMIERNNQHPEYVHLVESSDPQGVLAEAIAENPRASQIKAIIDSGGLFKSFDNLSVAHEILKFYENNDDVRAVAFFYKQPGKESANTPAFLKKEAEKKWSIKIPRTTQKKDIKALGIPLDKIFYFYDEWHSFGTDFPTLPSDAVCLQTIDENILRRNLFQGSARPRELFDGQDLEYVVPKRAAACMHGGGKEVRDFILTGVKNQAIAKSHHAYRYFRTKIEHAVRMQAWLDLIQTIKKAKMEQDIRVKRDMLVKGYITHSSILKTITNKTPYELYGALEEDIPTLKSITRMAEGYKYQFPHLKDILKTEFDVILKEASTSPYLPKMVPSPSNHDVGSQHEIALDIELNDNRDLQSDLELDLREELELHSDQSLSVPKMEIYWSEAYCMQYLSRSLKDKSNQFFGFRSLKSLLTSELGYKAKYDRIFDDNIYLTDNVAFTIPRLLPVYHKFQKPLDHLLVIQRDNQIEVLALSLKEAAFFKEFLEEKYKDGAYKNFWLVQPDHTLVVYNKNPFPVEGELGAKIKRAILQINFFNGNVQALDADHDASIEWLNENAKEEKLRFLKLKVEHDRTQKAMFNRSDLFKTYTKKPESLVEFQARMQAEEVKRKKISNYSAEEISRIDPSKVNFVPNNKVKYLIKIEQIRNLNSDQIPHVDPKQVPLLERSQIPFLVSSAQIQAVHNDNLDKLEPDQIPLLDLDRVNLIDSKKQFYLKGEQIRKIDPKNVVNLNNNELKYLDPIHVPYLQEDKIKTLVTPLQIKGIPDDKVHYIVPEQVCHLTSNQVVHIKGEEQFVERVAADKVRSLAKDYFKWLKNACSD